jgi:tetratricopeptide (TPR) repeat protein
MSKKLNVRCILGASPLRGDRAIRFNSSCALRAPCGIFASIPCAGRLLEAFAAKLRIRPKNFFFIPVFLCVFSAVYAGPREAALEQEKKGDRAGAAALYEQWLAANPASPEFTQVLFHAADIHPRLTSSLALLEKYLSHSSDKAARSAILGKTATLYEISGDFVKAQALFGEAYSVNPGEAAFPFLYRSARLLFELGEVQKSEDSARVVARLCKNPVTKKRSAFLLTRILAASGKLEEALNIALRLTEDSSNPGDNESIFRFIVTLADSLGSEPERSLALQKLAKDYPDSPEFRLASQAAGQSRRGAVTQFPTPSALLNPLPPGLSVHGSSATAENPPPAAEVPAAASAPETAKPGPRAVQTGSFSVRENAEYMIRDLARLGFTAEILEAAGKTGSLIYKVAIPLDGGPEEAQKLLIRLKEKSVEGFLLF